jgi:NAD(P)-dependent dehydrogenase (short-subunit alcohol dehydrogenase family)
MSEADQPIRDEHMQGEPTPREHMQGKICLVTGATSGIGRVTAQALAEQGATVVLVARDAARAQATVAEIKRQTGNPTVDYLLADLSAQAQVRQVAAQFMERYAQLHVLVNNAGALFTRRRETADGMEMTFALNHLAPFLLTHLLLDTVKVSAPARIVTVASAAHIGAQIPFDDLQQTHHRYQPLRVYGQTKLANLLFTYELARRLPGTQVTANALHPGFVATNFARGDSALLRLAMPLTRPFAISPQEGAQTSIYLATSPDVEVVSGEYFVTCKPARSSDASYDEQAARRLWDVSAQLTGVAVTA